MKNKLSFISIFTLCIALSLTACGGKQASNTASKNTQTEAGSEASDKSDISRKISFLQITLMYGTRLLA